MEEQTQEGLELGKTDDQSSSSAEGADNGKGNEEGKESKRTLTPEEREAERVEFGRRNAKRLENVEKTITNFADQFARTEETLSRFEGILTQLVPQNRSEQNMTDIDEDEYARYRKLRARERQDQVKYEKDYVTAENRIKDKDPVIHDLIHKEMFENFNEIVTGNPSVDAELNYNKARASLMSKQLAELKKKGTDRKLGPTGLQIGSRTGEQTEHETVLAEDAERYVKSRGLSPEFVKKALSEK